MIFPFKIIEKAPNSDIKIPKNCKKFVFVLKINHEKPIIITGDADAIKVELITCVVCKDMYVKELNIATAKTPKNETSSKLFL